MTTAVDYFRPRTPPEFTGGTDPVSTKGGAERFRQQIQDNCDLGQLH